MATPDSPDQAPIARDRSSRSNDDCRIASAPGVSNAAPTPCSTRAPTSIGTFQAAPHSNDATPNQITPIT